MRKIIRITIPIFSKRLFTRILGEKLSGVTEIPKYWVLSVQVLKHTIHIVIPLLNLTDC